MSAVTRIVRIRERQACCPSGHPREESGAVSRSGKRYCRKCNRDADRRRRAERQGGGR